MFHSISWRLQVWYGLLFLVALVSLCATAYHLERTSRLNELDVALQLRAARVLGPIHRVDLPPPRNADGSATEIESPRHAELFDFDDEFPFYYRVWGRNEIRSLIFTSATGPENVPPPDADIAVSEHGTARSRDHFRERIYRNPRGLTILVGRDATPELEASQETLSRFAIFCLGVFLLALLVSHVFARRAMRPIAEISAAAQRIAEGSLDERIDTGGSRSELGQLGEVLNRTFDKLEREYRRQERFTADASHELRTPVAVILSEIQSAPENSRSVEEYEECLKVCEKSATTMQHLLQQLLTLAQFDAGNGLRERSEIDLRSLVQSCVDQLRPIAGKKAITISETLAEVSTQGDADRIRQLITNLLNNALTYNSENGEVQVELTRGEDRAVLSVSDTGIGISEDDLPHLFERFFRADKSRFLDEGQSGLGLAICREIVEAHGGTISVQSEFGTGSRFSVELPERIS